MALLEPAFLKKLASLSLKDRRRAVGVQQGKRRSPRRGQSQEFADHRPYVPGDDLRHLDWHLYGRLDALWVKLFEEEQDRNVQLLLDCSGSMEGPKLDYARQLAAALGYVALGGNDRVTVAGLSDAIANYGPPRRGRKAVHGVFSTLEQVHPGGGSLLARALDAYPRQRGSGLALLFTDFLYPEGPDKALRRLLARNNAVHCFHVLSPEELRPAVDGDLVLVDGETGEELAITVDDDVLDQYEATVQAWADEMATTCKRLGVGYTRLVTSTAVEEVVLDQLRRAGMVGR